MKCSVPWCDGELDSSKSVENKAGCPNAYRGCTCGAVVYPCGKCGALHFGDGTGMIRMKGDALLRGFAENGEIVFRVR